MDVVKNYKNGTFYPQFYYLFNCRIFSDITGLIYNRYNITYTKILQEYKKLQNTINKICSDDNL